MKVLNLYAGIGGNRKLWPDNLEITAVEINPQIAEVYAKLYPNDKVIVGDAHQYLIDHYTEFDFIWSSPPCPTHSRMRTLKNNCEECIKKYPDMKLYEEIIYLKHFFKGKWVVENVISYYDPLIRPFECENHYFWSNFIIPKRNSINRDIRGHGDKLKGEKWGFDLNNLEMPKRDKQKMLNNLVHPNLGLFIFDSAFSVVQKTISEVSA
jgi:DNA (cytosine-5)-methyltransferase 1